MTATQLRQNLFRVLRSVAEQKREVTVTIGPHTVRIVPETEVPLMDRLQPHNTIAPGTTVDDLLNSGWKWSGDDGLS